jgi:molybdopterin/thiamine biosynthesis adenylyltransferase/rhodanese-related sulfurtransferase
VGIGTITVVDPDIVELSNLHRQVIHTEAAIGTRKIDSAKAADERDQFVDRGPHDSASFSLRTTLSNSSTGVDIVVDGSDNFATRYLANDACEILGIPLVWGTILGFDGQVAVFDAEARRHPARPLPEVPAPGSVPDCSVAGVLGPLCGSIGSAMAMEAIKVITGIGTPLFNSVAIHSSLDASWETVPVPTDSRQTSGHRPRSASRRLRTALVRLFQRRRRRKQPRKHRRRGEHTGPATLTWADIDEDAILVDIRDDDEVASGMVPGAKHIPMEDLLADPGRLQLTTTTDSNGQIDSANRQESTRSPGIAVYCRSGVRSAKTAAQLRSQGIAVTSISGGYLAYLSQPAPQRR